MPADLEQLKMKYGSVLNAINQSGVRLAHVHIQDDKLYIEGACGSEAIKNKIWDQAKLVDPSYSDLTLNLTVDPSLAPKQRRLTRWPPVIRYRRLPSSFTGTRTST